jgi:hypothetical protein
MLQCIAVSVRCCKSFSVANPSVLQILQCCKFFALSISMLRHCCLRQTFHKDGHHIPVRDHRPRWIMGLYYPGEVKLDMGPTCIVPQSQYFEVDRLQWGTLATGRDPPTSATAPAYQQWAEAVRTSNIRVNGSDPAARDEVLERTGEFFGSRQKKLTVPAGGCCMLTTALLCSAHQFALCRLHCSLHRVGYTG